MVKQKEKLDDVKGQDTCLEAFDLFVKITESRLSFSYFLILIFIFFWFIFIFLFLELMVRSHDARKDIEGSRRSDVIQYVNYMLTSCFIYDTLR